MISSMTAFGRMQREDSGYLVAIEIRTLNSRSLDMVLRLSKPYQEFEEDLRKRVTESFRRGRVEVAVQIEPTSPEKKAPRLSPQLALYYWNQLHELQSVLPGADRPTLRDLLQIPHLYETMETGCDPVVVKTLLQDVMSEALSQVQLMRSREGEALGRDCLERLGRIEQEISTIEERKDIVLREYQERLLRRMEELLGAAPLSDRNRVLQEVACMAERADINEEIVRLKSHIHQMRDMLTGKEPADGRRLDFLTQELHREVNTIGCKTGDLAAIQSIVRMKSEIGKLREQVQNIE
ncbi:MAG: YicC family protein [Syntrophobacteraceae bacterium]|nr:YicC family protein [Syntrophobacteraceae bacterium]